MKLDSFKRLADKIMIEPQGCWLWTGKLQDGYGITRYTGKARNAHRTVYELLIGKVGDGLVLDHLCRSRACCNPAHLEPVTQSVNTLRGDHWQRRKSCCIAGHEFSVSNTYITNVKARVCIECRRRRDRLRCPRSKH